MNKNTAKIWPPGGIITGRRRFIGGKPWAPTDIDGCILWCRADDVDGLDDGDPVGTWEDQSGNGNDATQSTEANKPTFKTDIINNRDVIRFGNSKYLVISEIDELYQPGQTVVIVAKENQSHAGMPFSSHSGSGPFYCADSNGSLYYMTYTTNGRDDLAGDPIGDTDFHVLTWHYDGSNMNVYKDGTVDENGPQAQTGELNDTNYDLWISAHKGSGWYWDGDIAEIMVWNTGLGGDDLSTVHSNVMSYYGL